MTNVQEREQGVGVESFGDEAARAFVAEATNAVVDLLEDTLGPNGQLVQVETQDHQGDREVVLSADAGELLDAIQRGGGFTHPVAALFVDGLDSMTRAHGDGTTRTGLLAGELVEAGLDLVEDGLAPNTVAIGYAIAASEVGSVFDDLATPVASQEGRTAVARTAMPALDESDRDRYAAPVAEAVQRLEAGTDDGILDTGDVRVIATADGPTGFYQGVVTRRYATGAEADPDVPAEFDPGLLLDDPIDDATVAVFDDLGFEETATTLGSDDGVVLETPDALDDYQAARARRRTEFASRLATLGVDVLVAQASLDDSVTRALQQHGVHVVDTVQTPKADVHRIARATGATIVSHPDDVTADRLGTAGSVAEHRVGDEYWTVFDDCDGGPTALIVGAETDSGRERIEAALETAIDATATAVRDDQVLPGGGAAEQAAASALRETARSVEGREQLAVEAFADALESIPRTLAQNSGRDHVAAIADLRQAHAPDGKQSTGLDRDGQLVDAHNAGILDPRRTTSQAIETARALAVQLLTIDTVLHPGVDLEQFRPRTES